MEYSSAETLAEVITISKTVCGNASLIVTITIWSKMALRNVCTHAHIYVILQPRYTTAPRELPGIFRSYQTPSATTVVPTQTPFRPPSVASNAHTMPNATATFWRNLKDISTSTVSLSVPFTLL